MINKSHEIGTNMLDVHGKGCMIASTKRTALVFGTRAILTKPSVLAMILLEQSYHKTPPRWIFHRGFIFKKPQGGGLQATRILSCQLIDI
jgi:hypothetical protein